MTKTDSVTDPLFATTAQAPRLADRAPVVVVGLPRSGSSLLSHILSQTADWYVFDDLYTSRRAYELGAKDGQPMTRFQFESLVFFLGWQVRARLKHTEYARPSCTLDEVDSFNEALHALYADRLPTWSELQEEWMARLALRAGATRWGWKQPGAFRMLGRLETAYPGLRTIYLMRRPEAVLASYKYMPKGHTDGTPAQYHPIAHSYYWRQAARSWIAAQRADRPRTFYLRFEDMTADPVATGRQLGAFLGSTLDNVSLPEKPNSSFDGPGGQRRGLTGLETRLLKAIAQKERNALFPDKPLQIPAMKANDLADITWRSFTFLNHQRARVMERIRVRRTGQ